MERKAYQYQTETRPQLRLVDEKYIQEQEQKLVPMRSSKAESIEKPLQTSVGQDLQAIDALQERFNRALGISSDKKVIYSYNPVLARWKYEQLQTRDEKQAFRLYEEQQVKTNYRERWHTKESTFHYTFDDEGKLRNEFFPDEPFEEVLDRGVTYREKEGSKETEREWAEVKGFQLLQEEFARPETPVGHTKLVFSIPGEVDDSPYTKKFADLFIKEENQVQVVRFELPDEFDGYDEVAKRLDPQYFDMQTGAKDAWYLTHPFDLGQLATKQSPVAIIDTLFGENIQAMKEETFQAIYTACLPVVQYYLDVLTAAVFEPEKIALAWNAVLNKGDHLVKRWKETGKLPKTEISTRSGKQFSYQEEEHVVFFNIAAEVDHLGRMPVAMQEVGCGASGGFSTGKKENATANSVSQFGVKKDWEYHLGDCVKCKKTNTEVGPCKICKECEKKFDSGEFAETA